MSDISTKTYIKVLEMEIEVLKRYYYKPDATGTGHYNTAIGVLEERVKYLNTTV